MLKVPSEVLYWQLCNKLIIRKNREEAALIFWCFPLRPVLRAHERLKRFFHQGVYKLPFFIQHEQLILHTSRVKYNNAE